MIPILIIIGTVIIGLLMYQKTREGAAGKLIYPNTKTSYLQT